MSQTIITLDNYLFETDHACGRYTLIAGKNKLEKRFGTKNKAPNDLKSNYNVAPTQTLPVITNRGKGNEIEQMRWGFTPVWSKDASMQYKLINTRLENIEKPMWKKSLSKQRCLVPATGFYEWKVTGKDKTPYYIHLKNQDIFAFAGIFDQWTDKDSGEVHLSYSIITTEPNALMKGIHNRMPVILDHKFEDDWLNPEANDDIGFLEHLLKQYPAKEMTAYTVSTDVNKVQNNYPEILEHA